MSRRGSEQASAAAEAELEAAIAELSPRLLRYAAALCGDWPTAEDAAQDALAALVRRWLRHVPPHDPRAFAFAVSRRRAVRASVRRLLLDPLERVLGRPGELPDPERTAAATQRVSLAAAALAEQPRRLRATLAMHVGGLSVREIARLERCSESAVKMRLLRARRALRESLERRGAMAVDEERPGSGLGAGLGVVVEGRGR